MQRTSGKIIVLHKGNLELPSDISGIIYIDITEGTNSKKDSLHKELSEWI
jgi:predicted nucleotide-binding protein